MGGGTLADRLNGQGDPKRKLSASIATMLLALPQLAAVPGTALPGVLDPVAVPEIAPGASLLSAADREEALSFYAFGQAGSGDAQQLLYDPEHGLVVGYSARAASTLVVELFLLGIGELSAAVAQIDDIGKMKVHNFAKKQLPDRYRVPKTVLCRQTKVAHATKVTTSMKLVANPYTRAVSPYIHQMRTGISHRCLLRQRLAASGLHPMCSELHVSEVQADTIDQMMGNVSFVWRDVLLFEQSHGAFHAVMQVSQGAQGTAAAGGRRVEVLRAGEGGAERAARRQRVTDAYARRPPCASPPPPRPSLPPSLPPSRFPSSSRPGPQRRALAGPSSSPVDISEGVRERQGMSVVQRRQRQVRVHTTEICFSVDGPPACLL